MPAGVVLTAGRAYDQQEPAAIRAEAADHARITDLIRRTQAGERDAFDELYRQNVDRVYGICMRMAGSGAEAERLTQDAFVRLWKRIDSFRGESEFSSWLYRLTVNVVLEDNRSEKRRRARVDPVSDPIVFDRGHEPEAAQTESRLELEQAIAALPPGARQVLVMHDIEGYKHEEIARRCGTAVGTVKAQLHRARKLLRGYLSR
ncbi:MAG TPA: sigma-70 family RNA polymerase sigma factor [Longimicrobiales bacterium]|nr:sigma-70 family RNA polymerase sigma factor [Longimicrobiales bacterium]